MGLKKYEIITVGSNKRVRALRSWQVQDRYVNIGDVGGIVYDEKTLSQDGACWLFRGNFGFPGARIGGDSVVDVKEGALPPRNYNVDILGSSTFVGGEARFNSNMGTTDSVTLTAADFEQGSFSYATGLNWETMKVPSGNYLRTKNPIFAGGVSTVLKCEVPGYLLNWYALDRDGVAINASAVVTTGVGVTTTVTPCQYFLVKLSKNPNAPIVPADVAAEIKYTPVYEGSLTIIDSKVEINPPTSNSYTTWVTAGVYTAATGISFQTVIRGSTLKINRDGAANTSLTTMAKLVNSTVTIDNAANPQVFGAYENVKNLTFSGSFSGLTPNPAVSTLIQAYDCDNMVVNATNFPGLAAMQTAGVPIRFYNCNLNNGRFYHHAQIANTYRGINFDLATKDLGKTIVGSREFVSSEVEGMYRVYSTTGSVFGGLVESFASVDKLQIANTTTIYNTTIYKDAYFNGAFDIQGTNVFGNAMKHEASNTQVMDTMLYQGKLTSTVGEVPSLVEATSRVSTKIPFRINGPNGILVDNIPAGIDAAFMVCDAQGKFVVISTWKASSAVITNFAQLRNAMAYITFKKTDDTAISLDEVKGVTVTTYNGCRIINTKATAATIAGNVRVEDNATLIDASVTGTGYFGGNAIIQAPSALVGQLPIEGAAYMSDNAVFAPSGANASAGISLLEMKDNATFAGQLAGASTNCNITMADNARFLGALGSISGFNMHGNSFVAAAGTVASACRGLLTLIDDARIEAGSLTAIGHITLCGKYKQTADKVWTGKRVISSQDAPTYDDNVKTKYDF